MSHQATLLSATKTKQRRGRFERVVADYGQVEYITPAGRLPEADFKLYVWLHSHTKATVTQLTTTIVPQSYFEDAEVAASWMQNKAKMIEWIIWICRLHPRRYPKQAKAINPLAYSQQ